MKKISDFGFVMALVIFIAFATFLISSERELLIEFTNCPEEIVKAEIGDIVELEFTLQAGSSEVISIFYYFELNGDYYSRLPLDREFHSDFFDFPNTGEVVNSGTFVEKLSDGDSYYISIDVLDNEFNSAISECEIDFS